MLSWLPPALPRNPCIHDSWCNELHILHLTQRVIEWTHLLSDLARVLLMLKPEVDHRGSWGVPDAHKLMSQLFCVAVDLNIIDASVLFGCQSQLWIRECSLEMLIWLTISVYVWLGSWFILWCLFSHKWRIRHPFAWIRMKNWDSFRDGLLVHCSLRVCWSS